MKLGLSSSSSKPSGNSLSPNLSRQMFVLWRSWTQDAWNVVARIMEDIGSKWKCAQESWVLQVHSSSWLKDRGHQIYVLQSPKQENEVFSGATAQEKDISHYWDHWHLGSTKEAPLLNGFTALFLHSSKSDVIYPDLLHNRQCLTQAGIQRQGPQDSSKTL